jgi:hypothetical protein
VALVKRDWINFKIYGFVTTICLIVTLINPLGWHIYEGAAATVGSFVQAHITEWLPYYKNISIPGSIPGIIYIFIFVAFELRANRLCPLESRLLSWLFLFLGFLQFRYMSFFFLFSTVPMAFHLDRLLPKRANNLAIQNSLLVAGIVATCVLSLVYTRVDPALGLSPMLSEQDARYLETHFPHARLLNHWNYGGVLIFRTRGTIPVFVDGRASTVYPETLLNDYFKLGQPEVNEADWDMVLKKYKIDTVLWVRAHEALRRFLVGGRGWKEAYTGPYVSIYVRP